MLADIPKRRFDMIVVWNSDRLSRDVIDGLTIVKTQFNKYGIKFASVTEDIDTSTPDGMMMFTMRLMFAQRERERIAERVTMGMSKKASTGRRVSLGPVMGYDNVDGKLIVNESEAQVVRRVFELYVYKMYGLERLAAMLNSEGWPRKKGGKWYSSTVKRIILNQTYIGYNVWTPRHGDSIVVKGEHEPIVSEELFELAQTQFKRRTNLEVSRSSYPYPFSTIVKCGECGASYTAMTTQEYKGKRYVHYRCMNKRPGLCSSADISGVKLTNLFFEYFDQLEVEAEEYIPEATQDEMRHVEKEKSRIDREIKKLEKRKSTLLDNLGDNIITRDDYKMKVAEINESMDRLRRELDLIEPQEVSVTRSPKEIIDRIKELHDVWPYMEDEHRKYIVQMIFKRIVIKKTDDKWSITHVDPA
jgi:site-specific DNA recombinase